MDRVNEDINMQEIMSETQRVGESIIRLMDSMISDFAIINEGISLELVRRQAPGLAYDMGYRFVKQLDMADILALIPQSARDRKPANELRSFRQADIVLEANDDNGETVYIVAEVSFTADQRDTWRARRNAHYLTEFTGKHALPAIASIRNDYEIADEVEAGDVYWYQLVEEEMLRH